MVGTLGMNPGWQEKKLCGGSQLQGYTKHGPKMSRVQAACRASRHAHPFVHCPSIQKLSSLRG